MWKIFRLILLAVSLGTTGWLASFTERKQAPPSSKTAAGPSPSEILEKRSQLKPPILETGERLQGSVAAYVSWAGASTQKEKETVRRGLLEVKENREIGVAFCDHAKRVNHSL
jgi:hypothetical protein